MITGKLFAAAAALALTAGTAQAAVIYDVTGSFEADTNGDSINEIFNFAFSYTAPSFITTLTQATPTSCSITGTFYQCGPTSTFDPGGTTFGPPIDDDFFGFDVVNTDMTGSGTSFYFFEGGAFGAVGVYSNAGQPNPSGPLVDPDGNEFSVGNAGSATLRVSQFGVAAVPEPSTWAMMLAGFGLIGGAMRRRDAGGVRVRFA